MEYIEKHEPTAECFFCRELAHEDSPENLIVYRGQSAFAILNRFPYTSGHLMVAPYAHRDTLEALDPETRFEIMELANRAIVVLRAVYHPEAFNLGANIGTAAGAGVAHHVHVHVVPRWAGDTNFMTTVGGARVLPEELPTTYWRVRQAWVEV